MGELSLHWPCARGPDPREPSQFRSSVNVVEGWGSAWQQKWSPQYIQPPFLQGCSGDEREMAKMVADTISRTEKQLVVEGQEPANFWVALGGKAPYANTKR